LGLDQKFYFEAHLARLNKQVKLLIKAFMDLIFSFFNLKLDMLYQFILDQLKKVKYLLVVRQYEFEERTLMQHQDNQFQVILHKGFQHCKFFPEY
jgi:hypothetical protein